MRPVPSPRGSPALASARSKCGPSCRCEGRSLGGAGRCGMEATGMTGVTSTILARTYREHGGRIHAALVRRFHDLDLAEDAVQEALVSALEQWGGGERVPEQP